MRYLIRLIFNEAWFSYRNVWQKTGKSFFLSNMFFTVVQWWKCLAADNLSILNIYLHWKWPVPAPGLWEFDLIKAYLQHRKRKKFVVEYFFAKLLFLTIASTTETSKYWASLAFSGKWPNCKIKFCQRRELNALKRTPLNCSNLTYRSEKKQKNGCSA